MYICCLQDSNLRMKNTHSVKVKGWKKTFHENGKEKKAGVAILLSDKIFFKTKITIMYFKKMSCELNTLFHLKFTFMDFQECNIIHK